MPTQRQRAVAASAETRSLFPEVVSRTLTDPTSYFYPRTSSLPPLPDVYRQTFRSAVMVGDPLQYAKEWQNHSFRNAPSPDSINSNSSSAYNSSGLAAPEIYYRNIIQAQPTERVLILNTASDKRPGGEWEGGVSGAEESIARRTNLVQALSTVDTRQGARTYYPLPHTAGIYSANTVVFRSGPEEDFVIWREREWTTLSIVSVAPVRRPKLDESGTRYSFQEERNLQREKMKTVLRIAANNGHINLVLSSFGSCPPGHADASGSAQAPSQGQFRNPLRDVCRLWRDLLLEDDEFSGWFRNVVFVVANKTEEHEFHRYFG